MAQLLHEGGQGPHFPSPAIFLLIFPSEADVVEPHKVTSLVVLLVDTATNMFKENSALKNRSITLTLDGNFFG